MTFTSAWITTKDFINLPIISVFHKQYEQVEIPPSAFENYHVAFRGRFTAKKENTYTVHISADDVYKLYINGHFVGQGVKQGYAESYSYNTFDITPYVEDGENTVTVHAFYFGRINRAYQSADNRFGIIVDILENETYLCGTDETWKYSRLPEYVGDTTWGYDTGFLENIDFRLEQKGWREKDFDDSLWESALTNPKDDHVFRPLPTTPVSVEKMCPETVEKVGEGHYILDFGKEITGQFYMEMTGKKDETVRVLCGEELLEDGFVRYDMRCRCKYEETCTLSGEKDIFLFFDYKAFRYVEIETASDALAPETFAAIVRHKPFRNRLRLKSENETLQKIWTLCENSLICGAQECIMDCPSREKGQYFGDFVLSGMAHLYLTDDKAYFKEILQDFADSCKICPGMMGVAPGSLMQEIADTSLEFPVVLYAYLKHTGDKEGIRPFLPVAEGVMRHFSQFVREDGLLDGVSDKWNLVDWPDNLRDGYDFPLVQPPLTEGCHNVINAHYIGALSAMHQLYAAFSMPFDTTEEERAKNAFMKVFYDKEKKLFRDAETSSHYSLHASVLPAYYGFQPPEASASLIQFIEEKGLVCGVRFAFYVLKALIRMGAHEAAYRLLLNDSEHGWVNMLREGATCTFEAWGKEQKWNTSLCHPWGASPVILLCDDFDGKFGIQILK